jgi:hypothetical protein
MGLVLNRDRGSVWTSGWSEASLAEPDQSHRQLVRFGETRFQELRGDLL